MLTSFFTYWLTPYGAGISGNFASMKICFVAGEIGFVHCKTSFNYWYIKCHSDVTTHLARCVVRDVFNGIIGSLSTKHRHESIDARLYLTEFNGNYF